MNIIEIPYMMKIIFLMITASMFLIGFILITIIYMETKIIKDYKEQKEQLEDYYEVLFKEYKKVIKEKRK